MRLHECNFQTRARRDRTGKYKGITGSEPFACIQCLRWPVQAAISRWTYRIIRHGKSNRIIGYPSGHAHEEITTCACPKRGSPSAPFAKLERLSAHAPLG